VHEYLVPIRKTHVVATITHPSHAVCGVLRIGSFRLPGPWSSSNSGRSIFQNRPALPANPCGKVPTPLSPLLEDPSPPTALQIICEMQQRTLEMSSFEIQTFSLTSPLFRGFSTVFPLLKTPLNSLIHWCVLANAKHF